MKRYFLTVLFLASFFSSGYAQDGNKLPKPDPAFNGKVSAKRDDSKPDWPQRVKAHSGAPNVVLILLDDVGFGATSAFGGPVDTPELQKLADGGLRYNRFHVNAMCSPTRAALLSGRNSHQMTFGNITELAAGYPGYTSLWPKESVSVAEVLKENGYSTAAFGKWHNTPMWEVNAAGPFDHWPTGLGFEYFYGFLGAQTSQWEPTLYRNTLPVDPLAARHPGDHLTTDLVDDAIGWVHRHDALVPDKPFFLYFATGATHVPHHVSPEWIAKYKGKFDEGWDVIRARSFERQKKLGVIPANAELTLRPKEIPAWDTLTADEKKLVTRQMEVYAAFLEQTDYEVGRLLAGIRGDGHNEDTIIFYIPGDNGASAEGGYQGRDAANVDGKALSVTARLENIDDLGGEIFLNHYATSWAWALNSPFQWAKEVASHLGGTRDPLIVSWPGHIHQAGVRSQFTHVNDIAPTIYELASITPPAEVNGIKQTPLEGVSFAYTFDHPDAPSRHNTQYFEMLGSRGIYKDGWWAGSFNHLPWPTEKSPFNSPPETKAWELYHLDDDYSQAHDVASQYPDKLKELENLFDAEAKRNHVYPLEPLRNDGLPLVTNGKTSFVYRNGQQPLPSSSTPRLSQRAHVITADLDLPPRGATGAIVAQGGRYGGFTLYVKNGSLVYESNINAHRVGHVVASEPLPAGKVTVTVEFTPDTVVKSDQPAVSFAPTPPLPGVITLSINGKVVGSGHILGIGNNSDTFDIGYDRGSPVSSNYTSPFAFTGQVESVRVDLK